MVSEVLDLFVDGFLPPLGKISLHSLRVRLGRRELGRSQVREFLDQMGGASDACVNARTPPVYSLVPHRLGRQSVGVNGLYVEAHVVGAACATETGG